MPKKIKCPDCRTPITVQREADQDRVWCPGCGRRFRILIEPRKPARKRRRPEPPAHDPPPDDDVEDDRPVEIAWREDDDSLMDFNPAALTDAPAPPPEEGLDDAPVAAEVRMERSSKPRRKKRRKKKKSSLPLDFIIPVSVGAASILIVCICHMMLLQNFPSQAAGSESQVEYGPNTPRGTPRRVNRGVPRRLGGSQKGKLKPLHGQFAVVETVSARKQPEPAGPFEVTRAAPRQSNEERPLPSWRGEVRRTYTPLGPGEPQWDIAVDAFEPPPVEPLAADLELTDRPLYVIFGQSVTIPPILADHGGPFALLGPEGIVDEPLYEAEKGPVTIPKSGIYPHQTRPNDGYDVIDLCTGQSAGKFVWNTPIWQEGTVLSPDGQYCVGLDPLPERFYRTSTKDNGPQLTVWKRDARKGPVAKIPITEVILSMQFINETDLVLITRPFDVTGDPPLALELWNAPRGRREQRIELVAGTAADPPAERKPGRERTLAGIDRSRVIVQRSLTKAVSPDGRFLGVGLEDGLTIVSMDDARVVGTLSVKVVVPPEDRPTGDSTRTGIRSPVIAAGFTPDGRQVAVVEKYGNDYWLAWFDLTTGGLIRAQRGGGVQPGSTLDLSVPDCIVALTRLDGPGKTGSSALGRAGLRGASCLDPFQPRTAVGLPPIVRLYNNGPSLVHSLDEAGQEKITIGGREVFHQRQRVKSSQDVTDQVAAAAEMFRTEKPPVLDEPETPDRSSLSQVVVTPPHEWRPVPAPPSHGKPTPKGARSSSEPFVDLNEFGTLGSHAVAVAAVSRVPEEEPPTDEQAGEEQSGTEDLPSAARARRAQAQRNRTAAGRQTGPRLLFPPPPDRIELSWTPSAVEKQDSDDEKADNRVLLETDLLTSLRTYPGLYSQQFVGAARHEMRAAVSPDQQLLAVTTPTSGCTAAAIYDRQGERQRLVQLSTDGQGIDALGWLTADRFFTFAGGRFTIWSYPDFQPQLELAGNYRALLPTPNDAPWLALLSRSRIDLVDAATGDCLARCRLPVEGEISQASFSPDGQKLAVCVVPALPDREGTIEYAKSAWPRRNESEATSTYENVVLLWDLQTGQHAELPTSIVLGEETEKLLPQECFAANVGWFDNSIVVIEQPARLVIDLQRKTAIPMGSSATLEAYERMNMREEEINVSQATPLRVRVGFPNMNSSQRVARMYATQLAKAGYTIGPGGNTLTIVAGYAMTDTVKGLNLTLHVGNRFGPEKKLPVVVYTLTTTDPSDNVISESFLEGHFPGTSSRYYRGGRRVKGGDQLFSWEFPGDVTQAILDEILERGIGLIRHAAAQDKGGPATADFVLEWKGPA